MQEGNAVDTDADNGDDFNEMENLFNGVLGNDNDEDDDDYNAIADNDINSKDDGSGEVDINNKEEEFFPLFKEEEGATVTTTE